MRKIIHEIYLVASAKGLELEPKTREEFTKLLFNRLVPLTYLHRPSMLQDIEKGKRTEIDYLNGMIAQMGKDLGVHTPANQIISELIKCKDKKSL